MNKPQIKRVFFVSTGRCGTTRIAEILRRHLPIEYTVLHQTKNSRRANIFGNIQYHLSIGKTCSTWLFKRIIKESVPPGNIFISTDPLISMVIPDSISSAPDTVIIHISRDANEFAHSMYNFTRKKKNSFIAHNFIPFWQPHLLPMENLFNSSIIEKYKLIHTRKNKLFREKYSKCPGYYHMTMAKAFQPHALEQLLNKFWALNISIPEEELRKRTNQSL